MMRPRRIYVGADLERLFGDYLSYLAGRSADLGLPLSSDSLLLVNCRGHPGWRRCAREQYATRSKRCSARESGRRDGLALVRHSHATALLLAGTRSGWCLDGWVTRMSRRHWISTVGFARTGAEGGGELDGLRVDMAGGLR